MGGLTERIKRFVTDRTDVRSEHVNAPSTAALMGTIRSLPADEKGKRAHKALRDVISSAQSGATPQVRENLLSELNTALTAVGIRALTPAEQDTLWGENHVHMHN
jgi:hypothetical protein